MASEETQNMLVSFQLCLAHQVRKQLVLKSLEVTLSCLLGLLVGDQG